MPSGFQNWSRIASSNQTADTSINWQEGQPPSSVNDSARGMMAVLRAWGDDISGAIVTGGTATAYTVASYSSFTSLPLLDKQMIAFTPHATNGATVTLNVDGLGTKPLRSAPSVELPAGVLVQGTPYAALYNATDGAFYLHGFFTNPYSIPIGGLIDFTASTAPNSSFVLPYGQAISRATYSVYFGMVSTTYGSGDGSTTFNIPDLRGRVIAGKDDMGGAAASRLTSSYFGGTATNLGAVGGSEGHTLTTAQLASHSHANTLTDPGHVHNGALNTAAFFQSPGGGTNVAGNAIINTSSATTGITITNASAGSGSAHNNTQPTIVLNKLLRII